MEIETEHGTVLLDDEDAHLVAGKTVKVRVNPTGGYRDVLVNGRPLHRLILPVGAGLDVDHINRNPLDNRRANLRPATRTQNLANRKGWGKYGKGVDWEPARPGKGRGKFVARIKVDKKKMYVGRSDSMIEAQKMYDKAAVEYFGEFACTNFPQPFRTG